MVDKLIEWMDRAKSRVYGVFFIWLALGLLPVIFTALFVDQKIIYDKTHLLKNEYVRDTYFIGPMSWYPIVVFLVAIVMTRLTIWDFPKWFVNRAYKKEIEHQTERDIYQIRRESALDKERKDLANAEVAVIKAETKVAAAKKVAQKADPTIIWSKEYNALNKTEMTYLKDVLKCLYEYRGNVLAEGRFSDSPAKFVLNPDSLRFADSNDLVKIVNDGMRIEVTTKGKYFASRFDGNVTERLGW